MLGITRRVGERIAIGDDIVLHVQEVGGSAVRIGIEAPKALAAGHVPVDRGPTWT